MRARRVPGKLVAAALLLSASMADAALTTNKCLVSKRKAWIGLRKCQAAEEAKALLGKEVDLTKCDGKFQEKLAKIDDKATDAGIACRYGDNGNGTVTDYRSGLQWEKKTGLFVIGGFVCVLGDPLRCVNNRYNWNEAMAFADATADGATLTTCFAGRCDWRLPKISELQTILLEPAPCGTSPCIDPIFGPTNAGSYWSSTALVTAPETNAWLMDFTDGDPFHFIKVSEHSVRLVRDGL
jgi:hypothetical protein